MGSYWYVENPESEFGYTPIPEEEFIGTIFRIVRKHGVKITDKMILNELEKMREEEKRGKKKLKKKK